jgi:hypothetical protein
MMALQTDLNRDVGTGRMDSQGWLNSGEMDVHHPMKTRSWDERVFFFWVEKN